MQAITRVNRVYKDKPSGWMVGYIGITSDLKKAPATYTESEGRGEPTLDIDQAVCAMQERFEVVERMLSGFDYRHYFDADISGELAIIPEAEEFVQMVRRVSPGRWGCRQEPLRSVSRMSVRWPSRTS